MKLKNITINKSALNTNIISVSKLSSIPFSTGHLKHEERNVSFLEAQLAYSILESLEGDEKKLVTEYYTEILNELLEDLREMHKDGKARNNTMLEGITYRLALTLDNVTFYKELVSEGLIVKERFTSQSWKKKCKDCYEHIQNSFSQESINDFITEVIAPKLETLEA